MQEIYSKYPNQNLEIVCTSLVTLMFSFLIREKILLDCISLWDLLFKLNENFIYFFENKSLHAIKCGNFTT